MRHPFIEGVKSGALERNKFHYYLQQDVLYLFDYSRALAITASKMENSDDYIQFMQFAQDAMSSERAIQVDYFQQLDHKQLISNVTPACFAYRNFLLSTAMIESVLSSVVALLPCFYLYAEMAKNIGCLSSDNHYQFWVDIYRDAIFLQQVDYLFEWLDEQVCSELEKLKLLFLHSMNYEWQFWDDAYYMRSL